MKRSSFSLVTLVLGSIAATLAGTAVAAPVPVPVSALAHAVRAGTLGLDHGITDACTVRYRGRLLNLGCGAKLVTSARDSASPLSTAAPAGYGPGELAKAYHLPSGGSANTVAIVGVGAYPSLESDLAHYRQQYGLPECTTANGCLTVTDYHGGPALASNDANAPIERSYATETALDLDMASAACPGCKIRMVQIPTDILKLLGAILNGFSVPLANDFGTAVNYAASHGAGAVSMSYGLPNGILGAGEMNGGAPAKALNHTGMAVLAASGDGGYTGTDQRWPQELPWVTSVGGTTLKTGDGGKTYTQQAWGGMFKGKWVGAGSGCNNATDPAVGQPASVSTHCSGHRAASDVSAVADPTTGVAVYDTFVPDGSKPGWLVAGGTSAASPFIAGLYARGGHIDGVHGPNTMYTAPKSAITDVTGGSNAEQGASACRQYGAELCTGAAGWDGPTGAGIPNGLGAF
ncbi:S53 family peptidase [Sciscionella marina]|uniref:S53 family peptidase n=1 Tax=Sciscionella marina TaxID=508770 RepID=UPI00037C944D|nr:S8 family serine peptidase [Sciscionella marina]